MVPFYVLVLYLFGAFFIGAKFFWCLFVGAFFYGAFLNGAFLYPHQIILMQGCLGYFRIWETSQVYVFSRKILVRINAVYSK